MATLTKLTTKAPDKRKKLPVGKYVFQVNDAYIKPKKDDENVMLAKISATTKDGTTASEFYYLGYLVDDGVIKPEKGFDEFKKTMYSILGLDEPTDLDDELAPSLVGKYFEAEVIYRKSKKNPKQNFLHFVETSVVEAYCFDDPGDE